MSSTDQTDQPAETGTPSTELELTRKMDWLRSQLEQVQEQASAALAVRRTVGPLDQWVTVVRDYEQLANTLCRTEFVPKEFRGKPEQTTAAMMFGREIGLQPMTTLQNTFVVHGRVGMYAEQLRAMILAAGHEYSIDESTSDRCVISGRRKGSERWSSFSYTMDMAKKAGLYSQNEQYQKRPVEMLFARATGLMAHGMFPDVIRGMGVVEELEDQGEGEPPAVQQIEPTTKVQRATKKAAAKAIEKAPPASVPGPKPEVVIPDEPGLPPLPGEVEPPADVKAKPTRTTEAEVTERRPGAPRCHVISMGIQCRYYDQHKGDHTFGGGMGDPVQLRHCDRTTKHAAHAFKDGDGKAWACGGGEYATPREMAQFAEEHGVSEEEQRARYASEGDGSAEDVAATGTDEAYAELGQEERHCPDFETIHDPHVWGGSLTNDDPAPYWCVGLEPSEPTPENPVVDLPNEAGAGVTTGPVADAPRPAHRGQVTALQARFKKLGYTDEPDDREARLRVAAVFAGVDELDSFNDLSYDGAMRVLRAMENFTGRDDVLEAMVQAARGEQGA
jgi:hypothetical protein